MLSNVPTIQGENLLWQGAGDKRKRRKIGEGGEREVVKEMIL